MVFNVFARNQDDHVKNFAYLMDEDGRSPRRSTSYANDGDWTSKHQTTVAGEAIQPTERHLLEVASDHGVRDAKVAIEEGRDAVARWPEFADQAGLGSLD